jgi:hypothetical protein
VRFRANAGLCAGAATKPSAGGCRKLAPAVSAAIPPTRAFGLEELLVFSLDGVEKALLPYALPTPFCEFKDANNGEEERDRDQRFAQIQTS